MRPLRPNGCMHLGRCRLVVEQNFHRTRTNVREALKIHGDAARALHLFGLPETIATVQERILEEETAEEEQAPIFGNNTPPYSTGHSGHHRGRGTPWSGRGTILR